MSRLSALSRLPTAVVASAPRRSMRVSSATVRRPASAIHHHSLSLHVTPALACSASRSFSITHSPSAHQPQLWSLTLIPHRCGAAAELKSRASSSSSSTPSTSSDSSSSDSSSSSSSYSSSIPRLLLLVVSPALLLSWLLCDDRPLQLTRAHAAGSLTADSQPSLSIAPKPHVLAQLAGDDYEVAAWWRRIIAFLVDNTIVSIAFQLTHMLLAGPYESVTVPVVSVLLNSAYEVACYVQFDGQTLGKWLTGIKVQRDDGLRMDLQSSALVFGGKLLNLFLFADVIYGLLNLGGDAKCLHNVLSGTTVVRRVQQEDIAVGVQV